MERDSRSGGQGKGSLEELMRERIRGSIEIIVEQELHEALGAASSERVGERRVRSGSGSGASGIATGIASEP